MKKLMYDSCVTPCSLSDRKPVEKEDEIIVMVVPDYQMLGYVEKIASDLSDDPVWILTFFSLSSSAYHTHISDISDPFSLSLWQNKAAFRDWRENYSQISFFKLEISSYHYNSTYIYLYRASLHHLNGI